MKLAITFTGDELKPASAGTRRSFKTLAEIVAHIRGNHPDMIFVGKDYSKADLIRDLERIDAED